jgi:hypothetical protein
LLLLELLLELLDLLLELFVLVLEPFDVDGGGRAQVALDVIERVARPVRLLVQAHQHLDEGIQNARLFEVATELFLL